MTPFSHFCAARDHLNDLDHMFVAYPGWLLNQLKFTVEDVFEASPGAGPQEIMQAVMAQPGIEGNYAPEEIMAAIEDLMGMNNMDIDPMEETVDDQYAVRATALNERLMRQWFKIK